MPEYKLRESERQAFAERKILKLEQAGLRDRAHQVTLKIAILNFMVVQDPDKRCTRRQIVEAVREDRRKVSGVYPDRNDVLAALDSLTASEGGSMRVETSYWIV